MSYTKTVNFQAKDALASGNPSKIIKGTEIDDEFDAIQVADALNLKRDGTTTASADIPMGSHKFTGLSAGTTAGDSVRYEQFASPPAIGGTAAAAGTFTTLGGTVITASTKFAGPGTDLSGTAASLSIGGNAATATSATSATTATNIAAGVAGQIPYQTGAGATSMVTAGSSHQVLKGGTTPAFANAITLGTPQATTSGTAWDFTLTGTVLELIVHINQLSLSGTDYPRIQIGPSGGVETSGYVGSSFISGGGSIANASGVDINNGASAAVTISGDIRFRLMNSTTNLFSYSGTLSSSTNAVINVAGVKPLAGALNKVRLTTIAGTDTGDGGSVNVSYI